MKNVSIIVLVILVIILSVVLYLKNKKQVESTQYIRKSKKSRINRKSYQPWMPNICSKFYKDHHEVWGKLNVIERDICDETKDMYCSKIVEMWDSELSKHFKDEEINFFPSITDSDNKSFINDLLIEHKKILSLVKKIGTERKKLDVLHFCSLMKYHIMKEEILMTEIVPDTYKTRTPVKL